MCSGADRLEVCIDIPNGTRMAASEDFLEHIPLLPSIRILFLTIIATLRYLSCPIGPSVSSFLRQSPNLTLLHIDLSTLHHNSRQQPNDLRLPWYHDDGETEAAKPWGDRGCDPCKADRDELQLGSLREVKISGFVGTDHEMELADLLFGPVWPALERISISSFAQLRSRMDRIAIKMKALFPLMEGRWETSPRKEVMWTKNKNDLTQVGNLA